jgi:hypothetical protein
MTGIPEIGDLVRNAERHQRIVTDIRGGQLILRPKHGPVHEETHDPKQVTLIARRGCWS